MTMKGVYSNVIEQLKKCQLPREKIYKKILYFNEKIQCLDQSIAEICAKKNADLIKENFLNLNDGGNFSVPKMWKVRNRLNLKGSDPPAAKLDLSGNLVTEYQALKELYKDTYKNRLAPKAPLPGYEQITYLKDILFKLRCKLSFMRKSEPWTENQLYDICKKLKSNKARDENGMIFELFKPQSAGSDLFSSLLLMFNEIKATKFIPEFMKVMSITGFYKNKGSKSDLLNDRGV